MIPYEKVSRTDLIFGAGRHQEAGMRTAGYSHNILLLYGGGSIKRTGL
jgi:alcohol dehydrogenase YqhD (iron-dependent ADH family)